ncbi:CAMK/CAMKL/KIN1 protein kinase [Polytolypa hystricis UAMH7299]|uniref:non-specific serine/threonine protein kinase n=1 Tax=Polytolypa hystricis (strain UAMH7299) TaxID=1447883 RepID=A0A2B7XQ70_POLH7|nr:CAMK/CAMKL/KIN1 protein kinase [Polytolypa hystricis UAMH7299]
MSAAASSAPPLVARSHSATRSHSSYRPATSDLPQRTRSTATRPSQSSYSHHRSNSKSQSRDHPPPSNQAVLANVARRDYETSNLAQPLPNRRSTSRDRDRASLKTRADTLRHSRTSSQHTHHRASSDMTRVESQAPGPNGTSSMPQPRRRTTINTATGLWALGKTIGAGSMGKVKLAKNLETGEQVAIKIVPRHSTEEHRTTRESERADRSKEIRTAREAAIVTLLNHPYVCGMRDVVRTNYHWYMLFEYVNGGQMLDYIISHGKLKEKQARKFGRQIASALDYCHRNSIVHRDLKIENILISKTGDIKIIDFGLSNLFSPKGHLKTFCGSLYFAAPELLQARQYTGPEVDVWSFGIVLYVLVCGKVPFDDQSMPQLHAKIKKGVVEYPQGLSSDCKHIISRMLVTDPKQRASLQEILNHPWMMKGYSGPPENYLPQREPLQLPLDQEIVRRMTGFDFGPPEYINAQLTKIIESEDYQNAVRMSLKDHPTPNPMNEKKRGVFDFYKRRNSASRDTLSNPSVEQLYATTDALNAYHPLVSVYYLVREKRDKERHEANPGALGIPQSPGEAPVPVPEIPAPQAAYTNQASYEIPGEKDAGGRSRPRARTHGEDELSEGVKKVHLGSPTGPVSPAVASPPIEHMKKENAAVGLLRRFSTRRTRDKARDGDRERAAAQAPSVNVHPPDELAPPRKSFSVRRSKRGDAAPTPLLSSGSHPQQQDLLRAPRSTEPATRSGTLLGRSTSVNSAEYRSRRNGRRGLNDPMSSQEPPLTSGSDRSSLSTQKPRTNEQAAQEPKPTARLQTLRTKSLGHARRESIQARRARREEAREANVPEETHDEVARAGHSLEPTNAGEDFSKPVYLKGLFSVSTTSSKPLTFIRNDIMRVLNQLGVEHMEIKGGFSCRHAPSIDLNRVVDRGPSSPDRQGMVSSHRRRISFGGFRGQDKDELRDEPRHSRSSRRHHHNDQPDRSFTSNTDGSEEYVTPHGERVIGETTTRVQNDTGENLVLKFEILIVKVPLFSLHGIQFKKVSGGMWQYREMAKKILDALRL